MNKNARLCAIISGVVLSIGLLLLFVATLTVDTKDVLATNTSSFETKMVKVWQGFSYNYISIGNMVLFNVGIVFSILGIISFIFCNLWLTKRMSKQQINSTFGKKINVMYVILFFVSVGLLVSFLAGGSWDSMMDPLQGKSGMATTIHKYIAIGMFGGGTVMALAHVLLLVVTKDIKDKVVISIGKGV